MAGDVFDGSQLVVSWNRYEQSLMKAHLMNCAFICEDDEYCFGDLAEVCQLYGSLVKHGILPKTYDYDKMNIVQLVNKIKTAIQTNLKPYKSKEFHEWYFINDDNETQFLTSFAMAVLDTKKRETYFPNGQCAGVFCEENNSNPNCYKLYFDGYEYDQSTKGAKKDKNGNSIEKKDKKNYITRAKMKLLSLATQLTRIGLNCKTTIHSSDRMRKAANQHEIGNPRDVHLIDTNNFLDLDETTHGCVAKFFNMKNLDIEMNGVQYYKNLYRKLFDFALKKGILDMEKTGTWKKPEFVIPLGSAWGTKLNWYIIEALNQVLGEKWGRKGEKSYYNGLYKDNISVKIIDTGYWHERAKKKPNLKDIGIVNYEDPQPLFNDLKKEHYMIMAGDHCAFLGNEAMYNGANGDTKSISQVGGHYNDSSSESANMKTDFFKFYGQGQGQQTRLPTGYPQRCGFHQNNGAWIMNPHNLEMPQSYLLHCNYQADRFHQMNENQQIQKNYNSKHIITSNPAIFKKSNFTRRLPVNS